MYSLQNDNSRTANGSQDTKGPKSTVNYGPSGAIYVKDITSFDKDPVVSLSKAIRPFDIEHAVPIPLISDYDLYHSAVYAETQSGNKFLMEYMDDGQIHTRQIDFMESRGDAYKVTFKGGDVDVKKWEFVDGSSLKQSTTIGNIHNFMSGVKDHYDLLGGYKWYPIDARNCHGVSRATLNEFK